MIGISLMVLGAICIVLGFRFSVADFDKKMARKSAGERVQRHRVPLLAIFCLVFGLGMLVSGIVSLVEDMPVFWICLQALLGILTALIGYICVHDVLAMRTFNTVYDVIIPTAMTRTGFRLAVAICASGSICSWFVADGLRSTEPLYHLAKTANFFFTMAICFGIMCAFLLVLWVCMKMYNVRFKKEHR